MLVLFSLLLSTMAIYCETIRLGMPTKRWVAFSFAVGPICWLFLKMHYRMAILKKMQMGKFQPFRVS
ncbi:hypothetical protein D9981_05895 [Pseudoalteromonas phenolica O-BC30]|nr:hypothetical protein D9981_05895 [Pseudoalteromonas phenolica O-BC30]TMO57549.1 hypothetical protein CWC21_03185 [Pseudoalteromonas phenolica]